MAQERSRSLVANMERNAACASIFVRLTRLLADHSRTMFIYRAGAQIQAAFYGMNHSHHAHMSLPARKKTNCSQPEVMIELIRLEYRFVQKRM